MPSIGDCTRFKLGTQYYQHNDNFGTGTILYFESDSVRVSFEDGQAGSYDINELELCACGGSEGESNSLFPSCKEKSQLSTVVSREDFFWYRIFLFRP